MADEELVEYSGWPEGLDNLDDLNKVPATALVKAENVDIKKSGEAKRRRGYALAVSGSDTRSGWSYNGTALFVDGGTLKKFIYNGDSYSTETVTTGLRPGLRMYYLGLDGEIFFSNGETHGKLDTDGNLKPWGVETPTGQPTLTASANGGMAAGTYLVAVTFKIGYEESGATLPASITLTEGQGIQLTAIPQPADANVDAIAVYVTAANGDMPYHYIDLSVGTTSGYVLNTATLGRPLETLFKKQFPPCKNIFYYRGRIYGVNGNAIIFTDPARRGLYTPRINAFLFPQPPTVALPVNDGFYVVADQTYFEKGLDATDMVQTVISERGAAEGSGVYLPKEVSPDGLPCVAWWSDKGLVFGLSGGIMKDAMGKYVADGYEQGALMYREHDGMRQIIASMLGGSNDDLGVTDEVTFEVRRNGLTV